MHLGRGVHGRRGWDGVLDVLIAQRRDGATWTTTQNSLPDGTQNVSLYGVSCTSPTTEVAALQARPERLRLGLRQLIEETEN